MFNKKMFGFIMVLCTVLILSACTNISQKTGVSDEAGTTVEQESKGVDLKSPLTIRKIKVYFPLLPTLLRDLQK